MNIVKPILIATSILLSQASFASEDKHEAGEKLYQTNCASCHGATGGMDMSKRLAPPIEAVRLHYINAHPDEESFVEAVSSWVEKQDKDKSLMRGAIQKFNIMPPLALVPKEDAMKIAAYIYAGDIEELEGFKKHIEDEHGEMGMGKEMHGDGKGQGMHKGEGMGKMKGMQGKGMGNMQGKGMAAMHEMMQEKGMSHDEMQKAMQEKMQGKKGKKGKSKKRSGKRVGMGLKMMEKLGLSAEQKQQMQTLIQEKEIIIGPLKRELHQINRTMRMLDTTSPDYKSQIFSLADEKAKRVYRMVIERGEMRMKIESTLTAEQRESFNQLRQKRQQLRNKNQH